MLIGIIAAALLIGLACSLVAWNRASHELAMTRADADYWRAVAEAYERLD